MRPAWISDRTSNFGVTEKGRISSLFYFRFLSLTYGLYACGKKNENFPAKFVRSMASSEFGVTEKGRFSSLFYFGFLSLTYGLCACEKKNENFPAKFVRPRASSEFGVTEKGNCGRPF